MTGSDGNAPSWLFAFLDLAFLLLLAMTQLGGDPNAPDLGELIVPRVGGVAVPELAMGAADAWQLRIHPRLDETPPFELIGPGVDGLRVAAAELRPHLDRIKDEDGKRPLVAPHADSRSQDLLEAVGLVEEVWPSRRRATVERVFAQQ
jgi:hypothetical protein